MVLSNAERQSRYRANLKNKASVEALGKRAEEVANLAALAIWDCAQREGFGEFCDYPGEREGARKFLGNKLVDLCRDYLECPDTLTDSEARYLRAVVEVDKALRPEESKRQGG